MPFTFNGESPKILTYNGNDVLKFISRIGGADDLIWQKATITAPSNLKVNGATSSTSSSCELTWDAATVTGSDSGITYHIYKDGAEYTTTASASYTFSASEITNWSNVSLTVAAYNEDAGYSAASNAVTFTYKVTSTTVTVSASKYATTDNSSFANSGGTSCIVGRSTKEKPVGTAMKFNAPSGGWSQFSKAVLHVQRTKGSASATVQVGKLDVAYSETLYTTGFYHGNYDTSIGSVSASEATSWFSLDISSALPSGSGELGITLTSTNAYAAVDGTNAYISLSN